MSLTFGSLFAGIGGIDLGLERAGMECRWQVEIDPFCQKVLAKHWPDVRRYEDVRKVGAHNLESVDLIAGGFPCQDISNAGRREGIKGKRSGLWFEMLRVICELRPEYILVENVAALLIRGMGTVLGDLAENGYDAEWARIPASGFGAPHLRYRVFIVAYPKRKRLEGTVSPVLERERNGRQDSCLARSDWWDTEPKLDRVADGIPRRVERLRALGNAVVPQVAEWIGRKIIEEEI